jgi:hypothetical protein
MALVSRIPYHLRQPESSKLYPTSKYGGPRLLVSRDVHLGGRLFANGRSGEEDVNI